MSSIRAVIERETNAIADIQSTPHESSKTTTVEKYEHEKSRQKTSFSQEGNIYRERQHSLNSTFGPFLLENYLSGARNCPKNDPMGCPRGMYSHRCPTWGHSPTCAQLSHLTFAAMANVFEASGALYAQCCTCCTSFFPHTL